MILETRRLEAFVKSAEYGSLTKAAADMGCTQSAVTHALADLEKKFGFELLVRSSGKGRAQLTENGRRLLPIARKILSDCEEFDQTVARIQGLDTGDIRVGTVTSVAVHWLPNIIKQFQDLHPNIRFRLYNGDYGDVNRWLADGTIDAGFLCLPAQAPDCECFPLWKDRLLAVLPKDHPMAGQPCFPVAQMADEPFISLLESSNQDARGVLDAAQVRPTVRFTTKDDYAIIAMVEQGLGVSIMPELVLRDRADKVATLELLPRASRLLGLALSPAGKDSPATRSFAQFVVAWIRQTYG